MSEPAQTPLARDACIASNERQGVRARSPQAAHGFPQTNVGRCWRYRAERRLLLLEKGAIDPREKEATGVIHRGVEWFLGLFRWFAWPFLVLVMLEQPPVLFKLV